jgi:hypothetical protein
LSTTGKGKASRFAQAVALRRGRAGGFIVSIEQGGRRALLQYAAKVHSRGGLSNTTFGAGDHDDHELPTNETGRQG